MASISLELQPFPVPDQVTIKMPPGKREDGMKPATVVKLEDLSTDVLEALLAEFCDAVMLKAKTGKSQG